MDLVGDLDRNLSVDLPLCGAHTRKSRGGGASLQEKYKPGNNNKGAVRIASGLFMKFVVAKPLAHSMNRRLFLCKPHLNKIDISVCDGRYLLIALVMYC